jgi:hypothetical protein
VAGKAVLEHVEDGGLDEPLAECPIEHACGDFIVLDDVRKIMREPLERLADRTSQTAVRRVGEITVAEAGDRLDLLAYEGVA